MKTVKTTVSRAILLDSELNRILKQKAKIRLKLELTEIQLRLRTKTEPAMLVLQEFFREHGKPNGQDGSLIIERFNPETKELNAIYKEVEQVNNEPIEFECQGVSINLLEELEDTTENYPELIRLIIDNNLDRHHI